MALYYNVLIYGSDTDLKDENYNTIKYPLKTDVLALTDCITSLPFDIAGYFGATDIESDSRDLVSGGKLIINNVKLTYAIQTMPFIFGEGNNNANLQFMKQVFNKRYKWLDLKNYPYKPYEMVGNLDHLLAVNITGFSISTNGGTKSMTINVTERP